MKQIIKEISLNGVDYTLVISKYQGNSSITNLTPTNSITPAKVQSTPITIYINEAENNSIGQYIYTIQSYSTSLNQAQNDDYNNGNSIDSLSYLLNKKLQNPVYLNYNGHNYDTTLTLPLFNEIIASINSI
ncbi:hypothetical protein DFJ63DRAFT_312720 [Scheffersomyces coipomensis]|uniref:uncharacterized protein n=1 Tax=Scheffersomyces coipomensis TaxID=1788519 RepID=UPI00315CF535